jgi:hypothetical protein
MEIKTRGDITLTQGLGLACKDKGGLDPNFSQWVD